MELGDVLRVLFYIWLLISVCVLSWQAYRRVVHHELPSDRAARRKAQRDGTKAAPGSTGTAPDPKAVKRSPKDATGDPPPSVPFMKSMLRGTAAPASEPPVQDGSLVREVIRQELAKKQGATAGAGAPAVPAEPSEPSEPGAPGRSGLFAKPQRPVAELLAGVRLPCDLTPLVTGSDLDPHHVLFVTADATAAAVASGMADELERLGFALETVSDNELLARQPEGDLRMTVHEDASSFSSAPGGAVVIELRS